MKGLLMIRSIIGVTALLIPVVAHAQSFEVTLTRPVSVGDTFRMTADGTTERIEQITLGGKAMPEQKATLNARIVALVEVSDVDGEGHATSATFTIEQMTLRADEGRSSPLEPGSIIMANLVDGDLEFSTVDGAIIDPVLLQTLRLLIEMPSGDRQLAAFLNPQDAVAVGSTWPVRSEEIVKALAKDDVRVSPADITGQATLARVLEHKGAQAMKVTATVAAKRLEIPPDAVPTNYSFGGASFDLDVTAFLPTDPAGPIITVDQKGGQLMRLQRRVGPELILEETRQTVRRTVKRETERLES